VAEWQARGAVADRYREGRTFIAGDAAHLIPPAGALGANTSIQDVHNLAWKLAFVIQGLAGPGLLDTYETERRPVGLMTVDQGLIRWQASGQHSQDPAFLDDPLLMFGVQYVSRAVRNHVPARPPQIRLDGTPGTRVPHSWLPGGESTLDLCGPEFTLFYEEQHWEKTAASIGELVKPCRIGGYGKNALLVRPDGYVAWRGDDPAHLPAALAQILDRP
jgi:putative polyketide hydroxylase